jgi:hypothetical protein
MADNPSSQPAPVKLPRCLRLALASVFLPLGTVVIGGVLFAILPATFFVALAFGLVAGIFGFCLSICSIAIAYPRRMAGTFVLGLIGFVLSGAVGFYSFGLFSFFLTMHGC